jgi:outer membrane protein OmpA-like peptidoglycan-associated protein/tetratricopeptide (TPR) repeat protein
MKYNSIPSPQRKLRSKRFSVAKLASLMGLLLCCTFTWSHAQTSLWERADQHYERGEYLLAAADYEIALQKGDDDRALERVTQCYRTLGDWSRAAYWCGKLAEKEWADPEILKDYADLLKMSGDYASAQSAYEKWGQVGIDPGKASLFAAACAWAMENAIPNEMYTLTAAPFNSSASDISPTYYDAGLVFASTREHGATARIEDARNGELFYDLYYADLRLADPSKVIPLKGKVNGNLHEGQATFSRDDKTVYYTKSRKKSIGGAGMERNSLNLAMAYRYGERWRKVKGLPFNSDAYSCGHPSLSADGKKLFFASDAPEGFGGADLYVSFKTGETWSQPVNLGATINTPGDELFPYIHKDGTLLFASDGLIGFGGLDIFYSTWKAGAFTVPVNLGYPLNGCTDDFSISMSPRGDNGYFASDRNGGMGEDDIYGFERQWKVEGTVTEVETGQTIAGVKVRIRNANGAERFLQTDGKGGFSSFDQSRLDLMLVFEKQGYQKVEQRVSMAQLSVMENIRVDVKMERNAIWFVNGKVTDAQTGQSLVGVQISYGNEKGTKKISSGKLGEFNGALGLNPMTYTLIFRKRGYQPIVREFSTVGKSAPEEFALDAAMEPGNAALIVGKIVSKSDGKALPNAIVNSLSLKTQQSVGKVVCKADGSFHFLLRAGEAQYLQATTANGYFSDRIELPFLATLESDTTLQLDLELVPMTVGALAKVIYYDYNKADLRKTSQSQLLEIVHFLEDNAAAKVELNTYTDARGSAAYNLNLSQQRAESAVKFIVAHGIHPSRIVAQGFGESGLVNECSDGVTCDDEMQGQNRRCELRITSIQ